MTEGERSLEDAIEELPDKFLDCRLAEHRWKRQGDPIPEGNGTFIIRWRCVGCRNKRFDRITRSGTLYARWYQRPEGYDINGFGHATRRKAPYRKALLDRLEESG